MRHTEIMETAGEKENGDGLSEDSWRYDSDDNEEDTYFLERTSRF